MSLEPRRRWLWIKQALLAPLFLAAGPCLLLAAALWRRLLFRTTFIAITGSAGKTTTKEVLADILGSRWRTCRTRTNQNNGFVFPLNVLMVRPWHRFAVLEIGIGASGEIGRMARALRPDIAVILNVGRAHTMKFSSLDACAAAKAELLKWLKPSGTAILNGDDPRVAVMSPGGVQAALYFGGRPAFDLWVDEVSGRWPDRLAFRVHRGGESCLVRTGLLGLHWTPSLAAALTVAVRVGFGLAEAVRALESIPPYTARMQPVRLPSGAVLVRDDFSATADSFRTSLDFLREARAGRRILAWSDFSDSGINLHKRQRETAQAVAGWLDLAVLVSPEQAYGTRKLTEAGLKPENVRGFASLQEAARFVKAELRMGDLVLLKGRTADHLARVYHAQVGEVSCWRESCDKPMLCDECWELGFRPDGSAASRM